MSTFFMVGAEEKFETNRLLLLSKLIDWTRIGKLLKGIHKNDIAPQNGGQKPFDPLKMLKVVLLKEWHSLSDPETENAMRVRIDFMLFTGFDLAEDMPDETTICRFRNTLIRLGLDKKIFDMINAELERSGLKVQRASGAVIDATIIESAARPRRVLCMEEDREETESAVHIEESVDKDARWLKKGKRGYFGYKGFAVTDADSGYIQGVKVEPANVSEVTRLEGMLEFVKAERLYADKGYASEANRDALKGKCKDGIMHKAVRGRGLSHWQKLWNKLISKERYIVEQCFGTLKRAFKFRRASYMGCEKVEAQMRMKAICFNLLKGLRMVELTT